MIPSLFVQVSFSHSVLMLGFLKIFLIDPNHVPNHSTRADQIPYEMNPLKFKICIIAALRSSTSLRSSRGDISLELGNEASVL